MTAQASTITHAEAEEAIQARPIELHVALGRAILKDPTILEEIPNGAVVGLLPPDADDLFIEVEIALGIDALKKGRSVYFKRLEPGEWGITPPSESPEAEAAFEPANAATSEIQAR
jgi:hypothetical protein